MLRAGGALTARRAAALVVVAALLALGWLGVTGLRARSELLSAQASAVAVGHALSAGDAPAAVTRTAQAQAHARAAYGATHDPLWRAAAAVPVLGDDLRAVRQVSEAARVLTADVLPGAATAALQLHAQPLVAAGSVDLDRLADLRRTVAELQPGAARAAALLDTPTAVHLPGLGQQLAEGRDRVRRLDGTLSSAGRTLAVLGPLLGEDGPRRVLVAVQNPAEARATGGLVGAFTVLRAERGRVVVERTGTDAELRDATSPVVDLPGAPDAWLSAGGTRSWTSANLDPHYPDVSRVLAGLWQRQTGQRVDATVSLDPVVLRELLRATGGVEVDGHVIDAGNVVDFVEREEYVLFPGGIDSPDNLARKQLLARLAGAVVDRVLAAGDGEALAVALARAAGTGHLLVGSEHPEEQAVLSASQVGGAVPGSGAYLQVLTQNLSANKVDSWVRREVSWAPRADGTALMRVRLSNEVPAGAPPLVALRLDTAVPRPAGSELVDLTLLGGSGAQWSEVRLDGAPLPASYGQARGHGQVTARLELLPGQPVVLTALVRQAGGDPVYRQQPRYRPDELHVPAGTAVLGG